MQRVWEWIKKASKRYFIDAMGAMALGLFSSLLIGQILKLIARIPYLDWIAPFADIAASPMVVGAAIGVSVAWGLKAPPLVLFSSAVAGAIGYGALPDGGGFTGGPVGSFLAVVVAAEIGRLVVDKTPVNIVLVPAVTVVVGGLVGSFVAPGVSAVMTGLGSLINSATEMAPALMGIIVSTVMGMVLTAPISSAALSISLGLSGLAAGAAAVGCSTQMVGFAVASWRENKLGGALAQGLGTSMLQFSNILRRPHIWIAPTLASAILGPVSSALIGMTNNASGAGMGTAGLVGQFNAFETMAPVFGAWQTIGLIALMHFVLPALLTLGISEILRKIGWVRSGDMLLQKV